jgi:hypothetical protein
MMLQYSRGHILVVYELLHKEKKKKKMKKRGNTPVEVIGRRGVDGDGPGLAVLDDVLEPQEAEVDRLGGQPLLIGGLLHENDGLELGAVGRRAHQLQEEEEDDGQTRVIASHVSRGSKQRRRRRRRRRGYGTKAFAGDDDKAGGSVAGNIGHGILT